VIINNINMYYKVLLRAKHNFSVLSKALIFEALINLILIVLLVREYKIFGMYMAIMVVSVLNCLYMRYLSGYRMRIRIKKEVLVDLLKYGFPIVIIGASRLVLISLDRIMIANMMGVTFVGYYSLAIMLQSYVGQLSSFGTVLYPRLMEKFGQNQKVEDIKKFVTVPTMINAFILPLILGLMFFIFPVFVKAVLPKFVKGILAMKIFIVNIYFASLCIPAQHFLIALKKQLTIMAIITLSIILNIVGNYAFIKIGYGIYGVAGATSIVTLLTFFLMQTYAMKHFAKPGEILVFLVKVTIPFIYTAAIVLFMGKMVTMGNIYVGVFIKCIFLIMCSIPVFVYIGKKTQIFGVIHEIFVSKFHRRNI
jgi:O-antigen/teichoic acid export membrane protein